MPSGEMLTATGSQVARARLRYAANERNRCADSARFGEER